MHNDSITEDPEAVRRLLGQIRVVLVGTVNPGNIGSAARAMKTMGIEQLYLVEPVDFPHREADYMSVSARDTVQSARVLTSLEEAVAGCSLVVGASTRSRRIQWPLKTPRACAEELLQEHRHDQVALVFGREDRGLHNEELQLCNWHVCIPANPAYQSLNLAAAVQIICYELRIAALARACPNALVEPQWDEPLATADAMELFYQHLEQTLIDLDFLNPRAPRQLMRRLRRLFGRVHLDQMELNILRGILAETQKCARRPPADNT